MGYLLQAVVVNVSPILFITLREQFHLTYSQLGTLVLANFITQLLCDVGFGGLIDRTGFKPLALGSAVIAALGFLVFGAAPIFAPHNPYPLFLGGTVLFAGAGGLLEILLSPIISALPLPRERRVSLMSFLHSAYSWGQVIVVLFTTLLLLWLGERHWQLIMLFWCLPAAVVFIMFLLAAYPSAVSQEERQGVRAVLAAPAFWLCMVAMTASGAGELIISQWSSSFIEKGLGVTKTVGDIAGVCAFAAAMGLGRTLYGKHSDRLDMNRIMCIGMAVLTVCYFAIGLMPGRLVPVLAIVISGLSVSLIWPGTLVKAMDYFPLAGSWMFAILAAGGDLGSSSGPWLTGRLVDMCAAGTRLIPLAQRLGLTMEQLSLRIGMLAGAVFPIIGLAALLLLTKTAPAQPEKTDDTEPSQEDAESMPPDVETGSEIK